ncbi:ABC transporter substrate-binding protein [Marinomonas epiphytica]
MKKISALLTPLLLAGSLISSAYADTLVINSDQADAAPKAAFEKIISKFKAENPDIDVKYNLYDKEAYKTAIRNWLATSPPDVVFWYAGNRMKTFVDRNLFADVSEIWEDLDLKTVMPSSTSSMTIDDKQWGLPYTYYQVGVYYRKDLFEKFGLAEPKTWQDLLDASATLKANNIAPIAIGTKYLWPAAAWFDYINLRLNGLEFHMDLMEGRAAYTDEKVRNVFKYWRELVDPGYFLDNHSSYSWQEAQPFLYNGTAAMYLIGNYIAPNFPKELDGKMGFFQFPIIDPNVPVAEDAPTDTIHIPAKAKNKKDARKFLEFMSRAENQTLVNEALLQIPTNKNASAVDNYFLNKGVEVLGTASGTAQFYDRDTHPNMAKEGMKGFQEFLVKPDRLDQILERLEKVRQRTFK